MADPTPPERLDALGIALPRQRCACGHEVDCATAARGGGRPSPGDLSICIGCGQALVYTDDMRLRIFTDEELAALPEDVRKEIRLVQLAQAAVVHGKGRRYGA